MGYNESMTALADAVRAKSGATGKLTVDQMTEAVNGITSGGGEGGGGTDTSDATVTADKLLKGVTAYGANGKVTGKIETVTPTLTDNVFTVPKGYVEESQTLTVAEALAPSVSGNIVTIKKGYNAEEKKVTVGTAKAAATIMPSTADQTIAEGAYLTGTQTIKGDANLIADNIKKDVSIFGLVGTFEGESGGGEGEVGNETLLYMPMNGDLKVYGNMQDCFIYAKEVEEGWGGGYEWTPTFDEGVFSGEQALSFRATPRDEEGYPTEMMLLHSVDIPLSLSVAEKDFTIDLWFHIYEFCGISDIFTIGSSVYLGIRHTGYGGGYQFNFDNGFASSKLPNGDDEWYHMALVRSGEKLYAFVNGVKVGEKTAPETISSSSRGRGGYTGVGENEPVFRIAHLRVLNYALWTENFTPPTQASYAQFMN